MSGRRLVRVLVADSDEVTRAAVRRSLEAAGIRSVVYGAAETDDMLDALEQERRELLARERSALRQAEAAACVRDEFLATLSHELRTPLNAILGWARLIAAGQLDEASLARAGAIIERNARTEVELIDELLDVSRLVTGLTKLEIRDTELVPLLQSAADAIVPATRAKDITVELDTSRAPERIQCDADRIHQIVWNFLSNSVKFTPRGGRISLSVSSDDRAVLIAVRDTGAGIKPEFLPYVFDRFRQQDAATTRTHGGLGAGLAVAKHLAELHGGSVSASSKGEGRGSTFTLTLPLTAAALHQH